MYAELAVNGSLLRIYICIISQLNEPIWPNVGYPPRQAGRKENGPHRPALVVCFTIFNMAMAFDYFSHRLYVGLPNPENWERIFFCMNFSWPNYHGANFGIQPMEPTLLTRLVKSLLILGMAPHHESGMLARHIWYKCYKRYSLSHLSWIPLNPLMPARSPIDVPQRKPRSVSNRYFSCFQAITCYRCRSCRRWAQRLESIVAFFLPSCLSSLLPLSLPYLLHKLFRPSKIDVAGLKTWKSRANSMGSDFLLYLSLRHNRQEASALMSQCW